MGVSTVRAFLIIHPFRVPTMGWLLWLIATLSGMVTGLVAWSGVGFQAVSCFVFGLPKSLSFWWRGIFISWAPIAKYMMSGVAFSVGGYFLAIWLWGIWNEAFDVGLLTGVSIALFHSLGRFRGLGNWKDFIETNRRYVDEEAVQEVVEDLD